MAALTGTKEIIFDETIRLISSYGYQSINMREIAKRSNIKAGSIYSHFKSKQDILQLIYSYFLEHFLDNRKPDEEIKNVISNGTKEEIIKTITLTFESDDLKKYERMILTSKIIYRRIFDDEAAKSIFNDVMTDEPASYVEKYLDYGVSIGRFKPFDTKTYAKLFVGCRHAMALSAFSKPDYEVGQLEEEQRLNQLLKDLLPLSE